MTGEKGVRVIECLYHECLLIKVVGRQYQVWNAAGSIQLSLWVIGTLIKLISQRPNLDV